MSRKERFSCEEKEQAVVDYINGNRSRTQICEDLNISTRTIQDWAGIYNKHGIVGFQRKRKNSSYSKEFKLRVIKEYQDGKGSSIDLALKYDISSGLLRTWIRKYNDHIELKDYCPKREVYMADARRKTTVEERKEIAEYCITHNRNYKETAAKYEVSYSQVYDWVKKYIAKGDEGLIDKRGIHKKDEELDELERLRRENKRLKRQLEEEYMLVELLKKVKEFEGM